MAQRFGGKYSPQGSASDPSAPAPESPLSGRRVRQGTARLGLLTVAAFPLLPAGVLQIGGGNALIVLAELGAFALIMSGIWMTREGLKAEFAFEERAIARPPRIPRKILGGIAIGAGVGLAAAFSWPLGLVQGGLYGALGLAAHLTTFGLDPIRAKGQAEMSDFERDRVTGAIDRAEEALAQILAQAERTGDRQVLTRVESFAQTARAMFRKVEGDPRDLPRARKYLGIYLRGTRDATQAFADLWARSRDAEAKRKYLAFLDDLDSQFRAQGEALLLNDRSALDIELEVLSDRLKQEGVRPRNME